MDQTEPSTERAGAANAAFGSTVVNSLRAFGVEHFLLCPGSRSTPLALAVGNLPAERRTVLLDERSAAFHALGRVKATRRPVALLCTSGTAAAEFYPAVIEAREAGLPLIVLTADRPPELRHCQAGQTIDQAKLYGTYPLFYAELPLPEPEDGLLRGCRELCRRAVESALSAVPGPVHLNCPFREPFFATDGLAGIKALPVKEEPVSPLRTVSAEVSLPARTLLLAGPLPWEADETEIESLLRLSREHCLPLLADAANPLRHRAEEVPYLLTGYDAVARSKELREELRPEALLVWGSVPTSKALRQWLAELDSPAWQAGPGVPGANPFHARLRYGGNCLAGFLDSLRVAESNYALAWRDVEARFRKGRETAFAGGAGEWFEGEVHRRLPELLAPGTPVLFANSLAVRDAEWFLPANNRRLRPHSLRGANGIDGTLSAARGLAAGSGRPAVLVTGDLAFLHDSNGLLGAADADPGLLVLLLNNGGGGIFDLLPVASRPGVAYEELFATPQRVDFARLVEAHGGRWHPATDAETLAAAVARFDGRGLLVVEIKVSRTPSRHRRLELLQTPL